MSDEHEAYVREVESQKEELLHLLAEIGIASNYGVHVDVSEGRVLSELFAAVKVAADNLALVASELERRAVEAEEYARTVAAQSETILELSVPAIRIWDEILVLPLIGTIDTRRARQIMENLLHAIVKTKAAVAIMDVTGVPVVDTSVADHVLKAIDAARLLGTTVILSGVSPHNAQTLVRLGIDLGRIVTKGSLQSALELAFEMTRKGQ